MTDGRHTPNVWKKDFVAYTDCGSLRGIPAQVIEVNRVLLGVAELIHIGHGAVFDAESFVC